MYKINKNHCINFYYNSKNQRCIGTIIYEQFKSISKSNTDCISLSIDDVIIANNYLVLMYKKKQKP